MGIINRELDVTEQTKVLSARYSLVATSSTLASIVVPFQADIKDLYVSVSGLSGSPIWYFRFVRNTSGGVTYISGQFATMTPIFFGTSGPMRASLIPSYGSTLLQAQAGDVLEIVTGVANTAVASAVVQLVVKATADYKNVMGVNY